MRLDDYRFSDNVSEQRGGGGGGGFGGGGGIIGLLFGFVLSRFGIGGVLILMLGYCALTTFGGGSGTGTSVVAPGQQAAVQGNRSTQEVCSANPSRSFSCRVLASTEDTWARVFQANGQTYQPPGLSFYNRSGDSGCGAAQSAMGPFYCPTDRSIYLDTTFFDELSTRFQAQGDFAQAYVVAHEVGHHIQNLTGVLDQARTAQSRASGAEGNQVQVRVELQADCYAGVYAANARDRQGRSVMEAGDLEEGLRAAEAIGDDTLQRRSGGRVSPESFTHGTSEQRMRWLRRGYESGNPGSCDTFAARTI